MNACNPFSNMTKNKEISMDFGLQSKDTSLHLVSMSMTRKGLNVLILIVSVVWFLCCCFYRKSHDTTSTSSTNNGENPTKGLHKKASVESFVPNNHNTFNTLHTPKPKTQIRKFFLNLWGFFSWFRQHTVRYAAKSMLIALAIASMAFIPATQEYFLAWKMDWTLITVIY